MTKISVALPAYNGASYIRETLDSILAQDFNDFELVVSDGGSTDETPEILAEYEKRDSRLRVYRSETRPLMADNYNLAMSLCKGEWIQLFCHDDIMLPGCLGRLNEVIEGLSDNRIGLVGHSPAWLFANGYCYNPSESGSKPRFWQGREYLKRYLTGRKVDNLPATTTALARKDALKQEGGFDPKFFHCDTFYWMRFLMYWDYLYIPQALTITRIHSNQVTAYIRANLSSVQEHRVFWPRFFVEIKDELGLGNWPYLKARLKPLAIAGHRIAVELMKGQFRSSVAIVLKLPVLWWPLLPFFVVRAIVKENRRIRPYKAFVPFRMIHP